MTTHWKLSPDVTSEELTLYSVPCSSTASSSRPSPVKSPATIDIGSATRIPSAGSAGSETPRDRRPAGSRHRRTPIGDGQIEHAVAGEVTRHDRCGICPGWIKYRGLECAVAVAEENRDTLTVAVDSRVRNSHVEQAVAIEVTNLPERSDRFPRRNTSRPRTSRPHFP